MRAHFAAPQLCRTPQDVTQSCDFLSHGSLQTLTQPCPCIPQLSEHLSRIVLICSCNIADVGLGSAATSNLSLGSGLNFSSSAAYNMPTALPAGSSVPQGRSQLVCHFTTKQDDLQLPPHDASNG